MNTRSGFSMIELVFVIVILGVLAAVAVPRFVTTRTDAQVAMARSDIASTLKAIPARVFAENLDPTASAAPDGYASWGEWIIDTGGLDRSRWGVGGNPLPSVSATRGVQPIGNVRNNFASSTSPTANVTGGCGMALGIDGNGNLIFNPGHFGGQNTGTFCDNLKNSYPSGSNRIIPLATTGAVKF
ncbi:type II secretion system protein [Helicobacter sp. 16-1353]|uniref:type II secretion system protein n=1 Tax=Helicobacter sp. 16-1353 TaxID=2004996 RepID=UPI0015EF0DCD|nr:type II secretion system protein [Helicobacter sp. 16-1353]